MKRKTKFLVFIVTIVLVAVAVLVLNPLNKINKNIIEVERKDEINFPWNHGWSPGISIVPGIPIEFNPQNSGEKIYFTAEDINFITNNGKIEWKEQPIILAKEETAYVAILGENDIYYVEGILKENDNITGYLLIKIEREEVQKNEIGLVGGYVAGIVKFASFPKQNDKFQNVTESYVKEKLKSIIDEQRK